VSDWKTTVHLVDVADVDRAFLTEHGLELPADRLRARFPKLAALAASTRFARVDAALAKTLHAAGVATYEVGYHRGSDGMLFADANASGRKARELDMGALGALLAPTDDDEANDRLRSDAVDAVLRILSEGLLTERAVIVAAAVPALSAEDESADMPEPLATVEGFDPALLPDDVTPELERRVAAALAELESAPRPVPGPVLAPEARRAYQKKAALVGLGGLVLTLIAKLYVPMLMVLAIPLVVFAAAIIALHESALRASARRS
jgi:hypothetical protein